MDNQVLEVGNKIELIAKPGLIHRESEKKTVYLSQILDFTDDDHVVAAMPIAEEDLIPLEVGTYYEAYFYAEKGIYRSDCKIITRGKERNIYIMGLELTRELVKVQRRDFFRCPCSVEAWIAELTAVEVLAAEKSQEIPEDIEQRWKKGTMTDISGGGVRILSTNKYEKDSSVFIKFSVMIGTKEKELSLMGRIVSSVMSDQNRDYYDSRIQFKEITSEQREIIVRFVFEQERILRRKERG